jgi:two-component system, NtrC family, nitrogen regulation sensor histidine kinase NtrY
MVYKKLYIQLIIRTILLVITSVWLAFELADPKKLYTIIVLVSLILIQCILIIQLLNRFNQDVYFYFSSLRDEGSSTHFKLKGDKNNELYKLINEVGEMIREARITRETHLQYLNFIVETTPVGILVVDMEGKVILSNKLVFNLFKTDSFRNLNELKKLYPSIGTAIDNIHLGGKKLVRVKVGDNSIKVLINLTSFRVSNSTIFHYTFFDVKSELDENEIKAWQKLIRVLNHELMNSITPITTLTHAIKKEISNSEGLLRHNEIDEKTLNDVLRNANLIEERSQGLIRFINQYRSLTTIKNLEKTEFPVSDLFRSINQLFDVELVQKEISLLTEISPQDLTIYADRKLIEQVMINLVKNAIEAIDKNSERNININALVDEEGKTVISVKDSGKGIDETLLEDIFVPFFTTKPEGSGIGLSFSKQVVRMHAGEIMVSSEPGKGSVFSIII